MLDKGEVIICNEGGVAELRLCILGSGGISSEGECYERTEVHCVGCTSLPVSK